MFSPSVRLATLPARLQVRTLIRNLSTFLITFLLPFFSHSISLHSCCLSTTLFHHTHKMQCNTANLLPICTSSNEPLSVSMGWVFGIVSLHSATPAALSSFSFSHTPRQSGRGGGTGLLISNNWKLSTHSSLCNSLNFMLLW